jgi:hypothetical protein
MQWHLQCLKKDTQLQRIKMEQRSEEWFAARCGKVTASRVADIIAKTKIRAKRQPRELPCPTGLRKRLTGKPAESYSNAAMSWGTEQEEFARAAYEARMDILVTEVGFIDHPWITNSGASPDGLAAEGMVEIKCPNTATHIETLLTQDCASQIHHANDVANGLCRPPLVRFCKF